MAEQPIKSSEIIDDALFSDAIKSADLFLKKAEEVRVQLEKNLIGSKAYFDSFKGEGAKSLKQLNSETVKVNATLKEYEATQLGIADIQKKQSQLKQELAKQQREELKLSKEQAKEEAKKSKEYEKTNGEYKKASAELSNLKNQIKYLTIAGKQDTAEFKKLNKEFELLDTKVRKADASVGDFQRNVGNYPAQLKAMQRELQGLEPGSKAFNDLAKRAGELKDKIVDAKDATKAFSSESNATRAKTLFGQIGNDLADLDFKGAAEKSAQFASVIKSISFTEAISGVKAFGSAILNVGKSLLTNPFVLIAAAIAGLVYVTYQLINSFGSLNEMTTTVNDSLKQSQKRIEELGNKQAEYMIRIREAQGKLTKSQADAARVELRINNERKEQARSYSEKIVALAKELDLDLAEMDKGRFSEVYKMDIDKLNRQKRFNKQVLLLEKQQLIDQKKLVKTQIDEKVAIAEEENAEELKAKKDKADQDKKDAESKRKQFIENEKELQRELEKARIENIQIDQQRELYNLRNDFKNTKERIANTVANTQTKNALILELEEKLQTEIDAVNKKYKDERDAKTKKAEDDLKQGEIKKEEDFVAGLDKQFKLNNEALEKLRKQQSDDLKKKKELQDKELKEAVEFSSKLLDLTSKEVAKKSEEKQKAFDQEISQQEKNIATQRNLAERGLANTLAEEEARKVQLERQKEEEKLKEIKRQKALAFFKLFSSYAEKDPNTALQKALKDTIIAEAVAGAFFTGTEKVEDDLKGNKVHNGRDGYRIAVDGSERILTGEQNKLVGNLSNEALADLAYKHNNGLLETAKFGVIPTNDFATNVANSALLMETMALRKEMQSIKDVIKNRPTTNFQFDGYGDFIKETIENGFNKRTTYKQPKPRI
jgi:hypothetical protein